MMRKRKSVYFWGVLLCGMLGISSVLSAQESRTLSAEWIFSDEGAAPAQLPSYRWLDDGNLLFYDIRRPEADRTFELVNPETGARFLAVDKEKTL